MRHRKHRHVLGVKKEHRQALLANLACSLIEHGRIKTSLSKARALRPFVEKCVTLAKKGDLHRRRVALSKLRDPIAVGQLFNERAPDFAKRTGGYTRIYKLAQTRKGDASEMALIEFVGPEDPGYKRRKKTRATRAAAAEPAAPAAPATAAAAEPEATSNG